MISATLFLQGARITQNLYPPDRTHLNVPSLSLPILAQGTFPVSPLEPAAGGMCASAVADFLYAYGITTGWNPWSVGPKKEHSATNLRGIRNVRRPGPCSRPRFYFPLLA